MRAGPKMRAGARPPTEKAPLELVQYSFGVLLVQQPVTPAQAHDLGPQRDRRGASKKVRYSHFERLEINVVFLEKTVV